MIQPNKQEKVTAFGLAAVSARPAHFGAVVVTDSSAKVYLRAPGKEELLHTFRRDVWQALAPDVEKAFNDYLAGTATWQAIGSTKGKRVFMSARLAKVLARLGAALQGSHDVVGDARAWLAVGVYARLLEMPMD
jgi:hypothetical protein